jgi:hypothetical protein
MSPFKFCRSWDTALVVFLFLSLTTELVAESWSIPVGGNAYRTAPETGGSGLRRSGRLVWNDEDEVHSIFFRVDRPAVIELGMKASDPLCKAVIGHSFRPHRFFLR